MSEFKAKAPQKIGLVEGPSGFPLVVEHSPCDERQVAYVRLDYVMVERAAGRAAGLREAAEVVEDWRREHAAAIEGHGETRRHLVAVKDAAHLKSAILALAKP